jgi:hypothetical protein
MMMPMAIMQAACAKKKKKRSAAIAFVCSNITWIEL